jgi:uncharacterized protein
VEYRDRTLSRALRHAAEQFPAVVLTGARQAGKTTLCRQLFGATHAYCPLDDPALQERARSDPQLLLAEYAAPVVFDEIQAAPGLLHAIKADIERHREEPGRFVLTGSQVFPLMAGLSESLAGRAAVLSIESFSLREAAGQPDVGISWRAALAADTPTGAAAAPGPDEALSGVLRGGYPEPALRRNLDARLWHASYVQTYLERDVRALRAVGDLGDVRRFLFALAARTGSVLNFEDLARDLGVTAKTLRAWTTVLEASWQIATLPPYAASLGKRLVKRPKVYFLDTGTLAYLLGVTQREQVLHGVAAGPLFETAVLGQLHRLFLHRGERASLFFWRTAAGHEVDFVVEDGESLIPVEAKLTATPTARDAAAIEQFQRLVGPRAGRGLVVCLCRERFPLTRTVDAVPLGAF